jgi:hypothetical protein
MSKVKWADKLVQIKIFNGQPSEQRLLLIRKRALMTCKVAGKSILKLSTRSQNKITHIFGARMTGPSSSSTNSGKSSPNDTNNFRQDARMLREKEISDEMYFSGASYVRSYHQGPSTKSHLARKFPSTKYTNNYDFVIK